MTTVPTAACSCAVPNAAVAHVDASRQAFSAYRLADGESGKAKIDTLLGTKRAEHTFLFRRVKSPGVKEAPTANPK